MNFPPLLKSFYDSLLESQYWGLERHRAEQRKYLRELLLHARAHVPFYAERLNPVFTPDGDIDWDRWLDLPTLTREDALAHNEQLVSTALPPHHGRVRVSATSGSTGNALRVLQSELAGMYVSACLFRSQRWFNLDVSRNLLLWFGEDAEDSTFPAGKDIGQFGPPWSERATGRRFRLNRYTGAEDVLRFMADREIGYLSARPAAAHAAALEAIRLGSDLKLEGILTFSTGARPDEREDCLKAFGAPMIVPYSAQEGQFIAHQCPTGTHFHINEELVFVEILDDDNRPCPPGVVGRVVVTPLFNYAQHFIRYELGDLAVFGEACGCGRTLRVIDHIAGRVTHMFRLPGGKRVAMSLSIEEQQRFGARYWQIAQVEPLLIEVRYVPAGDGTSHPDRLVEIIRQKTDPGMQVQFSRRTDLFRADGRKFIEYVCELAD